MGVSLRDGVRIELSTGAVVAADAERPDGDVNVLSHAHGDHLYERAPDGLVCSALTAALARVRRDEDHAGGLDRTTDPRVEQVPAGHVPGSRATVVEDPDGTTYLHTGDCSTRDRFFLNGLDPAAVADRFDVDVLVVESTYGDPEYRFPPQDELESRIVDWLADTAEPVLLMGYALGRAQELQVLADRAGRDRVFVTDAVADLNAAVEAHRDVEFGARRYDGDVELRDGDALVLPSQTNHLDFVDAIRESTGALKAGFSGWASDTSFRYRGDYDETFVLSDHCDHAELLEVVETLDPDRVYTHHGFAEALATDLTGRGYEARALKPNQTSLSDF